MTENVFEAVKSEGRALLYASEDLRNKFEFILEAVKNNGDALCYVSGNVRNEIVVELVLGP